MEWWPVEEQGQLYLYLCGPLISRKWLLNTSSVSKSGMKVLPHKYGVHAL
jgi:hypothetical protein